MHSCVVLASETLLSQPRNFEVRLTANRSCLSRPQAIMRKRISDYFMLLLIFAALTTACSSIPVNELDGCTKDDNYARTVKDNVSPWTTHLYNCRNLDPDSYWSVECLQGSCINPITNKPLINYTILPIRRKKLFKMRNHRGQPIGVAYRFVDIACKCVPNEYVKGNNLMAR